MDLKLKNDASGSWSRNRRREKRVRDVRVTQDTQQGEKSKAIECRQMNVESEKHSRENFAEPLSNTFQNFSKNNLLFSPSGTGAGVDSDIAFPGLHSTPASVAKTKPARKMIEEDRSSER